MIDDTKILEEVAIMKQTGMTSRRIAHEISRRHENYFKESGSKRSINFSTWDVLQALETLREQGVLPKRRCGKVKGEYRRPLKPVPSHSGSRFQNPHLEGEGE